MKEFFSDIFGGVGDLLSSVVEILKLFIKLLNMVLGFLPSPFYEIGLTFVPIWIGLIAYKLWKGN